MLNYPGEYKISFHHCLLARKLSIRIHCWKYSCDLSTRNALKMPPQSSRSLPVSVIILFLLSCANSFHSSLLNSEERHLSNGEIDGAPITGQIDRLTEYTYLYTAQESDKPIRIQTEIELVDQVTPEFPVIFQVRQRRLSQSWELPVRSPSNPARIYSKASRTLCSTLQTGNLTTFNVITLTVSTLSSATISFSIVVQYEHDFRLELNGNPLSVAVSPLSPRLLQFTFPPKHVSNSGAAFVQVLSKDLGCMTVSVQDPQCPFHDQEDNIQHDGSWQTMNTTAALSIQRDFYPQGFFIVLVMHDNSSICENPSSFLPQNNFPENGPLWPEVKVAQVIVTSTATNDMYLVAQAVPLLFILFVYMGSLICYLICKSNNIDKHLPALPGKDQEGCNQLPPNNNREDVEIQRDQNSRDRKVCLDKLSSKSDAQIQKNSRVYLHIVFIVAVLYFLPAMQLASIYQRTLHKTGNQDMCYYNFHCARPVGHLNDYNHVYSNIGYILLGILAVINVGWWERWHPQVEGYGIPPHYGILYALAWAIICEGLLSGAYHVCPDRSNFHHDTIFMFIAVLLTTLKLFQARHPSTNASGNTAFLSLVFIIVANYVAEVVDHFWFWMSFTLFYIVCSLIMAAQLFYNGKLKLDSKLVWRVWLTLKNDNDKDPEKVHSSRSLHVFICAGLIVNVLFAIGGGILRPPSFGFILLIIFTVNMILYLGYYVIMKVIHKESISPASKTLLLSAIATWAVGVYFFVQLKTNWEHAPAIARTMNEDCFVLGFYDPHDVWHFLSSFGLFFTLMGLLTLDDGLRTTSRTEIAVF